ncbi:MAG: iron-containing alcohol dehydrogenase [Deltaproteobacteria bacterium]|nr:iron-containing alcohol dehydrogenase [Deltaproteobacteria bacterium]
MIRFEFATTSRIIFGQGTLKEVPSMATQMGHRPLVVTGKNTERASSLLDLLKTSGMRPFTFGITDEPTIEMTLEGVQLARKKACDVVIGIGGGSVIDGAKAIAALLTNSGDIMDYLEVIGQGQPLSQPSAPCIAIPTTAGTGAEVTRNSVLASTQHRVKVSLRSPTMLPDIAVIDPKLTYSMPPVLTASTGLDALTQILEPFVSLQSNPLTDALCREGLKRVARSLRRAFDNGSDTIAREDMAIASLFGGLALANSKLGAVHGFAGTMGAMFSIPHGIICACLLPHVMEANVKALRRKGLLKFLSRYDEAARLLTGNPDAGATDGIDWIHDLYNALDLAPLFEFGITEAHFPEMIAGAKRASSMKGNPVELTDEELIEILRKAV